MAFENISRLGPRLLGERSGDVGEALKLDEQVVPISDYYRKLLKDIGGAILFDNGARYKPEFPNPLTKKDGYNNCDILYGLGDGENSIKRKIAQYAGELPVSFIPIGESLGGDLICVDGDGAVNLWDHESRRGEGAWRIAASVDEFLKRLEPDDSEIGTLEGIVESESFLDF